ncbi:MAG: TatD family hydrolase [Endomicrobiales bacterium]|nr:TatD family hydrolase [Endomicrobiales bacterium]
MYIDTHAHLTDAKFNIDRELVISRAKENNIEKIIEVGCEPFVWEATYKICELNPDIYCSLGIHPHDSKTATGDIFRNLYELCKLPKVVAVGETGLDFYYKHSDENIQKKIFIEHIKLAATVNKPIVIHCRQAYKDLLEILNKEIQPDSRPKGVVHCFSGNTEDARKLIDLGFYIGIDGPVTYPNAKVLVQAVKEIPVEKILLETDSPYLTPQQYRGKRNEPAYLPLIAEAVSYIKGIPVEKIAEITTNNAKTLFDKI